MANTVNSSSKSMGDRITISEAAKLVNKAATTIRRLVDVGSLKSIKDETGKHWIEKQAVISHYANQAHTVATQSTNSNRSGATASPEVAVASASEIGRLQATVSGLKEQLVLLQDSLGRERSEKDAFKKENLNLQHELLKITKEMQAILNKDTGLMGWLRTKRV